MKTTRRSFLSLAPAAGSAASLHAISARGREAWEAENGFRGGPVFVPPPEADEIRISSNENPLGPGPAAVAALRDAYGSIMRYPMNAQVSGTDLRSKIGGMYGGKAENVVLSAGSGEILRTAVRVYTGPDRPLVTAECSYESPVRAARYFGASVKALPLTGGLGLDLDKMAGAAIGAGLVFLCNPNNPTGTVHSLADVTDFVNFVKKESPYTAILLDEAYYDYASHPGFDTGSGLAMEHRDVFIARTFSKGVRDGRTPHRLRLRAGGHHREARAAAAHLRNLRSVHCGSDGVARGPGLHQEGNPAERSRPQAHPRLLRGPRPRSGPQQHELHLREHRPVGEGVPRGLRRAGHHGWDGTSLPTRTPTPASRSALSRKCSAPPRSSRKCSASPPPTSQQ